MSYNILEGRIACQIEIQPIKKEIVEGDPRLHWQGCKESEAEFFGVYIRDAAGLAISIGDFKTKEEAHQFTLRFRCIDDCIIVKKSELR